MSSAAAVGALALAGVAWTVAAHPPTKSAATRRALQAEPITYSREALEPDQPSRRQVVLRELRAPVPQGSTGSAAADQAASRGGGNGFYFGSCTWWVATKRPIPWRGDAWQWWANARAFGFTEGGAPSPGAVAVFKAGGWSPAGHVAFVEAVNPDGSFVVSEMNWGRWGVVDVRTITSLGDIVGFIY